MNWSQRTIFWKDFAFQVHVLENGHHHWFQVYISSDKLNPFWLETDSVPGMSTRSKLSGFINGPEVSVLYVNSCFHIIISGEQLWENKSDIADPTLGFFCRGSGRILNWKCRSESKERKIPNLYSLPGLISDSNTSLFKPLYSSENKSFHGHPWSRVNS